MVTFFTLVKITVKVVRFTDRKPRLQPEPHMCRLSDSKELQQLYSLASY